MHIYLQKSELNTTKITKVRIIPRLHKNVESVKPKGLNKLMNTILLLIVQRKILLNKIMSIEEL